MGHFAGQRRNVEPAWSSRRSALNHDWLKNVYLVSLGAWVNVLDEAVEDPVFEREFFAKRFVMWETRNDEAHALIESFEDEMSPRLLLARWPFSPSSRGRLGWVGSVIHACWYARFDVTVLVSTARVRLAAADGIYREIKAAVDPTRSSAEELRPLRDRFAAFATACAELSAAISRFPSDIRVV